MFGTGTAAIVSPVGNILYKDKMQSIPNSDDEKAISQRLVQIMYTRGGINIRSLLFIKYTNNLIIMIFQDKIIDERYILRQS